MFTLADVIFPAFYYPYVAQLFYPAAAIAGIAAEVLVFWLLNRGQSIWRLFALVVIVNIVSSVVGIALAGFLPSGLSSVFTKSHTGPAHGPNWNTFAWAGWGVAFLVSIAIEYVLVRTLTKVTRVRKPGLAVLAANLASYSVLLVLLRVSIWWSWHRF